ncbi:MAG: hypothetical protein U0359_16800 [Byssovorax sp.]
MKPSPALPAIISALTARYASNDEGMTALVDLAVLVALADGKIDNDEMASLAASLEAVVGSKLDRAIARYLILQSRKQIDDLGAEARAEAIGESLAQHGAAEDGLRLAFTIAWVSEGLSADERARIALVAKAAHVSDERFAALAEETRPAESA